MKFLSKLLACLALPVAALVLSPVAAQAQAGAGFSGTGTAISTTQSYYVVPGGTAPAVISFVQASLVGSEVSNATAKVQFYLPTIEIKVTTAAAASATTIVGSTNGLAANDVLVLYSDLGKLHQRLTVSSLSGSTITVNETITRAQTTRDRVYKMTAAGMLRGGNSIYPVNSYADKITASAEMGVFVATAGLPSLVEASGTNTPVLNVVSGRYGFWQP